MKRLCFALFSPALLCLLATFAAAQAPTPSAGPSAASPRKATVVDPADDAPADGAPAKDPAREPKELPKQTVVPSTEKVIEVPPAKIAPTTPGLPPKPSQEEPKPTKVEVKETQPVGAPQPPPNAKPDLSAPAPPPETLVFKPESRYYVMIFGCEGRPKLPRNAHTWMTLVKATPKDGKKDEYEVLAQTISWMPRTLEVRLLRRRPECGVNLTLPQSLNLARCMGACTVMYGPYEVNPTVAVDLYEKTEKQIARLNSGRVLYKCVDPDGSAAYCVCNCIHAVTDLDGVGRRGANYDEVERWGIDASYNLARRMWNAKRIDTSTTHNWLIAALDIRGVQQRLLPKPRPVPQPVTALEAAQAEAKLPAQ
jgi:hypothetical protein